MRIGVVGAGNIGATMGKKWAAAGHEVVFGVRDVSSAKVQALLDSVDGIAMAGRVADAIAAGDVVLLAVPWGAVAETVAAHAEVLAGKIVIDATNNFGAPVVNNIGTISRAVPSARIFRAFNSLGWEVFERSLSGTVRVDHFFCGPDDDARRTVEQLISEVGVRPVWVGDLDMAPVVDALGTLWVTLAYRRGLGRDIALKLVEMKG